MHNYQDMDRIQHAAIVKDLSKKMVLIAGPRQAGKTWLAKIIAQEQADSVYLNYDRAGDRKLIRAESWLTSTQLLILDEIHKMPKWKNYLKGIYDTKDPHLQILVTGSARLDIFNQVGDSLAGRYYLHHLLPLSPAELTQLNVPFEINHITQMGNFPEPFLETALAEAQRWRRQYINSLLREDVLDFDNIHNLRAMQLVFSLLRQRVGSPISYQSIAEDAGISPNTVKKYIHILEALYIIFIVRPYAKNIARSLAKEPKIYFFDTGLVEGDPGAIFENFVAFCLLKHVMAKIDYDAEEYQLHYLRTREKHEVDFALVNNGKIIKIIETKLTDHDISHSLQYFHTTYQLPAVQIVKDLKQEYQKNGIEVVKAINFLKTLKL
jgi:uncharacterized protein